MYWAFGLLGSQEEFVGQIESIQFADVGTSTDEDSSALCSPGGVIWLGRAHTRFCKPAKHLFLQLVYRRKLSRIQKSCISSVQLKRLRVSAHALRMAFQNALLHTRVVSSILASLILWYFDC